MSYAAWKWGGGSNIGGRDISYRQYNKINTAYQRSRFWRREFGVYLKSNGSAKITPWKDTHKLSVDFRSSQGNINNTMHGHWAREGQDWVKLPNGKYARYNQMNSYPNGSTLETTVGGYHSPGDLFLPGMSIVVGRTTSTYFFQGSSGFTYVNPDPFIRFFLFK